MNMTRNTSVITLMVLGLVGGVYARGLEDVAPKPVAQPEAKVQPQRDAVKPKASTKVLVKALTHITLTAPGGKAKPGADALTISGLPLLEDAKFAKLMQPYFGKPLTMALMADISRDIVMFYRAKGYPLVDAIAPGGQDITKGNVHFVVVEGRLGKLSVEGNRYFSSQSIASAFQTQPGDPLYSTRMENDLDWANRNPFRRVDLMYKRGGKLGETDAVLNVADRRPWRVYGGVDDTGTDLTGNTRLYSGVNAGDLFHNGTQLNYQFTGTADMSKMRSHAANATFALPWRHLLTASVTEQEVNPDLAAPLKSDGRTLSLGLKYAIPLQANEKLSHDVFAGYDYKRSNNNIAFGGTQVYNTDIDVSQFSFGYNRKQKDMWGSTQLAATMFYSPGNMTSRNDDGTFNVARAKSSADYLYGTLRLDRATVLPKNYIWRMVAQAQISNKRLPGSEEITAGGFTSVRGYDESMVTGDSGFLLRNEIQMPTLDPVFTPWADGLDMLAFVDYGFVHRQNPQSGETPGNVLLSVGPGLRYHVGSNVDARLDYGWQLRDGGMGSKGSGRAHFGLTMAY